MISDINEIKENNTRRLSYTPYDNLNHNRYVHSLSSILITINTELGTPSYNFDVVVKLYEDIGHGETGKEKYLWTPATKIVQLACVQDNMKLHFPRSPQDIVCALLGIVRKQNNPEQILFFPTLDLEVDKDDEDSFEVMKQQLIAAGLSGFIMESGFSYHYVGNLMFKYGNNYWKFLGYALLNLIDERDNSFEAQENIYFAKELGNELLSSETYADALFVTEKIFASFKSLPTGVTRPGLLLDPRWLGHKMRMTEL